MINPAESYIFNITAVLDWPPASCRFHFLLFWGFFVSVSIVPAALLLVFISFLLAFPKRKNVLSQNAFGKRQKEEGIKQKKDEKKQKAGDQSSTTVINNFI